MVLPSDVRVLPVSGLPASLRRRLGAGAGAYALARPSSRAPDKILAAASAELVRQFRKPRRIVDAIIAFSRSRQSDPAGVLAEAYPLLRDLLNERLLVPADSPDAAAIVPGLNGGDRVGGATVLRCVRVLSDTEVYQVRRADGSLAAMKITRPGRDKYVAATLAREARFLAHLGGSTSPRLLTSGTLRGRRYLMEEWRAGVSPEIAAAELRGSDGTRSALLGLSAAIVEAYAALHARGVVHGDVHPGNILIDADGRVSILDFGLSRFSGHSSRMPAAPRGGVSFYYDPEYAETLRLGRAAPPATERGEQYSVAAILYFLLTGHRYLNFSPHEPDVWRQIVTDEPLSFSGAGVRPWPEVESVLTRALRKAPGERFASLADFGAALRRVPVMAHSRSRKYDRPAQRFLAATLAEVGPDSALLAQGLRHAPTASVNLGAGGIAYGLYRIACVRGDAGLLSTADLWLARGMQDLHRPHAWSNTEVGITPQVVGRVSPYHCGAGLHCVEALLSQARGDLHGQAAAIESFVRASRSRSGNPELVLGKAGTILASALLRDAIRVPARASIMALESLGNETSAALLARLQRYPAIERCRAFPNLGVAHGWAGALYALIRWYRSQDREVPTAVEERLTQLAGCAEYSGRGAFWRWVSRNPDGGWSSQRMPGWCNGSAGLVFLWSLAHRVVGNADYLALATKAGWDVWESSADSWDLCCGLTGRAYAMLNLYKHRGEVAWLDRARDLASRAVQRATWTGSPEGAPYRQSLFRGRLGLATLIADLERPEEACLPMFEEEGWHHD